MSAEDRQASAPGLPRALAIVAGAVAAALLLFALVLAMRSQRGGAPPTEILGSQMPPGWEPGAAGVGRPPPPPPRVPTPSAADIPAAPPIVAPLGQPQQRYPGPEQAPPGYEVTPPPLAEATPPPPAQEPPALTYTPPRLLSLPDPSYPRMGERMRMEATVVLRVRVSSRGRVLEAEPIGEAVGYGFEAEAVRAARRARFEPARRDGNPVTADTRLAVRFRMQ